MLAKMSNLFVCSTCMLAVDTVDALLDMDDAALSDVSGILRYRFASVSVTGLMMSSIGR